MTLFQDCYLFTSQPTLNACLIARIIGLEMRRVMCTLRQVMFQKNNCNRQSTFMSNNIVRLNTLAEWQPRESQVSSSTNDSASVI